MEQAHICFSSVGIDEMSPDQQSDIRAVLVVLAKTKRFSVFDATANATIASTMDRLGNEGYIRSTGGSYPWCEIEITDKGQNLLDSEEEYCCGYNTVSGAFHKPGCNGECGMR